MHKRQQQGQLHKHDCNAQWQPNDDDQVAPNNDSLYAHNAQMMPKIPILGVCCTFALATATIFPVTPTPCNQLLHLSIIILQLILNYKVLARLINTITRGNGLLTCFYLVKDNIHRNISRIQLDISSLWEWGLQVGQVFIIIGS
ncbi:hypothetical protein BDN67DRAFT_983979 [Paxillus ammoniavirescens]|nr:hypothetical protein BDN67DRAFT_983979 [Paxillus ammoniavirescens]